MHSFDAGDFAGEQRRHCTVMPASDPSDETGIMKMADNAPAEKSGTAKYSHTRRHDAKVSRRLRLSYSHSTADQRRASQRGFRGGRQGPPFLRFHSADKPPRTPQLFSPSSWILCGTGLTGGGSSQERTHDPSAKGKSVGNHSRQALLSRA